MKQQLSPAATWAIIAVVVVIVIGIGYKMLGPKNVDYDKKGSEQMMEKVKSGGKMYEPPGGRVDSGGRFVPPGQN